MMLPIQIREHWDKLDVPTQDWLIANPGCVILPRTMVSTILHATHGHDDEDQHGEAALSPEDRAFIQTKSESEEPASYRFFDANQP
jgi:hypothetical protein